MSRAQVIIGLTVLLWLLILAPFAVWHAMGAEFCSPGDSTPPTCGPSACKLYGPGGCIGTWKLHVATGALKGKTFIVPARTCASACVLAVAVALNLNVMRREDISPKARFIVHNRPAFDKQKMPDWFRRLALAGG